MQADEVIKNKEWNELSNSERELIYEIAPDEEQFNFVKNILIASAEDIFDVPQIKKKERKIIPVRKFFYIAAASVIAIIFYSIIINKDSFKTKRDSLAVNKSEVNKGDRTLNDSALPETEVHQNVPEKISSVKKKSSSNKKLKILKDNKNVSSSEVINMTSTRIKEETSYDISQNFSVKSNPALSEFITEIY